MSPIPDRIVGGHSHRSQGTLGLVHVACVDLSVHFPQGYVLVLGKERREAEVELQPADTFLIPQLPLA